MNKIIIYLIMCCLPLQMSAQKSDLLHVAEGKVSFVSNAPLELIMAESNELVGLINKSNQSFGFQVDMNSFYGFNNPQQRIHFQENYLETTDFPVAEFSGKFIEEVDFNSSELQKIRAKGDFTVHGITQNRIIEGSVLIHEKELTITCVFEIPLADHEIKVPRIVYQKIAQKIKVQVRLVLQ